MRRDYDDDYRHDDDGLVETPLFSQQRSDFSTAPGSLSLQASPGAENSKIHCGDHDNSQLDGRWDDLLQSRRNLDDDSGVGGAKHRLEHSDPANVSTIDEWGYEVTCNRHDYVDQSHHPPRELSVYGNSLTLDLPGRLAPPREKTTQPSPNNSGGAERRGARCYTTTAR